ncbi:hypothetical protein BJX66DRAFT_308560 [Aspergillus keveii]|uniref:Uncharacterized protein n=1 Tax=Aspergillus keveii TaxID=714993 RepID=A0ABR4FZ76_9EURO
MWLTVRVSWLMPLIKLFFLLFTHFICSLDRRDLVKKPIAVDNHTGSRELSA